MFVRSSAACTLAISKTLRAALLITAIFGISTAEAQLETGWKIHDLNRPQPKISTPAADASTIKPPSDAEILFDGTDLSQWRDSQGGNSKWKIKNDVLVSTRKSGNIYTKKEYGDCQLHLEWAIPKDTKGSGQSRGNSGVFLMSLFEIQILDTLENPTYADGMAGSIYGQYPPLVNASRGMGEWQTYDIVFHRPRFNEDGSLKSRARITAFHNGVLTQDNAEILGPTSWIKHLEYSKDMQAGSLALQEHGNVVHFRNIWIRDLSAGLPQPEQPYLNPQVELSEDELERLVGDYGKFKVKRSSGKIYCVFYQAEMELLPLSKSEFLMKKCAGNLTFDFDDKGQVKEAKLQLDAAGNRKGAKNAATAK